MKVKSPKPTTREIRQEVQSIKRAWTEDETKERSALARIRQQRLMQVVFGLTERVTT